MGWFFALGSRWSLNLSGDECPRNSSFEAFSLWFFLAIPRCLNYKINVGSGDCEIARQEAQSGFFGHGRGRLGYKLPPLSVPKLRCELFGDNCTPGFPLDKEIGKRPYFSKPAKILNPCFEIAGESLMMATQFMASVPTNILRTPMASLQAERDVIVAAVDFLMQGF